MMTLADVLRRRGRDQPDGLAFRFLVDGESALATLTYGELDERACAVAAQLQSLGAAGQPVLLLYPPGLDLIAGFMGCLYSGAIAVPLPSPHSAKADRGLSRILGIARDARPVAALTTAALHPVVVEVLAEVGIRRCLATDTLPRVAAGDWENPRATAADTAFLQYTSGSTTAPKGVQVSHGNLMHNLALIRDSFGHTAASRAVIWLPPHHDMGLIGGILQPLFVGFPVALMSPVSFLQRPLRWLQAMTRFRATISGAPNFAYELCVRKVAAEQRQGLDLSSWEVAFNGAEQIQEETLERFAAFFAPCGFRRAALFSCYGLAESTLIVAGGPRMGGPVACSFSLPALNAGEVREASAGAPEARTLASSGEVLEGQRLLIVDPQQSTVCPPGRVGEIWLAGPSVAQGYWRQAAETERTFGARLAASGEGPFLRTGDLGFLLAGRLFVTGRIKDLIIIDGSNHYPQDIEITVEQASPLLSPGGVAAFAADFDGGEKLVILAEVVRRYLSLQRRAEPAAPGSPDGAADAASITVGVRRAVAASHGLRMHDFVLLKPGGIPRTSSGKIQRHLCRSAYLAQTLARVEEWASSAAPGPAAAG
jgi:acyl-CoA synthetase (AMP-forming)/AMP-acid ligase II